MSNLKNAVAFVYGATLKRGWSGDSGTNRTSRAESGQDSRDESSKESDMEKWILKASEEPEA